MKSMLLTETMKRLENWSVFFSETKGEPKNIRSKIFLFRIKQRHCRLQDYNFCKQEKYGYTEREAKI